MLGSTRVFIKVVELGSFSKAAKVLNIAPSSVARSIDGLEKRLNTALFKRSTRQLLLTENGHVFLEGAIKLIADSDALFMSLSGESKEPEGSLRISAFESFGRLHLCPIIPQFLERYPKIHIELDLDNQVVDLASENIDVAIRIGSLPDSSLIARKLLPNHTFICASPDYLARHGEIITPDDLASHNCLLLNQGRQRTYWHFKKDRRSLKVLVRGNLKSKGGTPLLDAALNGVGVTQLSNWVVSDFVKSGKLRVCLRGWESSLSENTSGSVYAVYQQATYPKQSLRLFIDYLIEQTRDKVLYRTI